MSDIHYEGHIHSGCEERSREWKPGDGYPLPPMEDSAYPSDAQPLPASESAARIDLASISLLPDGITVERDVWGSPGEPRWFVHDRETGLHGLVSVDTTEHEVEWTPPPKPPWWRWVEPLGAALDSIDRENRIARMRGKKVVDWDAVDRDAKEQGYGLIRELLDRRPA